MLPRILFLFCVCWITIGCQDRPTGDPRTTYIINAEGKGERSTTAGNLITSAIREANNLDVVLYPVDFLDEDKPSVIFKPDMNELEKQQVLDYYPDQFFDIFMIGTMKGEDIAEFVRERAAYKFAMDLEVAGLVYSVGFAAGVETSNNSHFMFDWNAPLEDDRYYRVAISEMLFFNGVCFPCYLFGDNLNFRFNMTGRTLSAKDSLKAFMDGTFAWPWLNQIRGRVFHAKPANKKPARLKIPEIQGESHISPYWKHKVITRGVVTAAGINQWYPGGVDVYIQDATRGGDGNDATSEGIHVYLDDESILVRVGDFVEVEGTVFEQMAEETHLSRTSIRNVTRFDLIRQNVSLPVPVVLGDKGREIPKGRVSTYRGDLNEKPFLKLSDPIDFWESLEGMRVSVNDLKVVGFRGGNEDHVSSNVNVRGYLNLYVVPDGAARPFPQMTKRGDGIYANIATLDWNPEIMQISTNHLSAAFDPSYVFNVGDDIPGKITGVLGYERNIFGSGEFSLILSEEKAFDPFYSFLSQKCENIKTKMLEDNWLSCLSEAQVKAIKDDQCLFDPKTGINNLKKEEDTYFGPNRNPEKVKKISLESVDGCDFYTGLMGLGNRSRQSLPYYARLKDTRRLREKQRERNPLRSSSNHLTVGTFNVENLAGNEPLRIQMLAESIVSNMKCPDIVSLVEIQDDNGSDFTGSASANLTLRQVLSSIESVKSNYREQLDKRLEERGLQLEEVLSKTGEIRTQAYDLLGLDRKGIESAVEVGLDAYSACDEPYEFINIDPLANAEGGKPGGNIRVAFLYKKGKVDFQLRPLPSPREDTVVKNDGSINYNPGRIYPNHEAFKGSRRSVIAEFGFRGEKVFFIGNHFNSKLGDSSHLGSEQPVVFDSEVRRIPMAETIRTYVQRLLWAAPKANVIVVGDFNAFMEEASMKVLKGKTLVSLTEKLMDLSERYTTNHNGNSQSLDYIFVNREMMSKRPEVKVLHINSDHMGRISDHDPVVARFWFPEK